MLLLLLLGLGDMGTVVCHVWSSHTSDLKTGTLLATLPDARHYRVSARAGWPAVSLLRPGEIASLIGNLCVSVASCEIVCLGYSLHVAGMLSNLGNKQTTIAA